MEVDVTLNWELLSRKTLDKVFKTSSLQKQSAALDHVTGVTEER